MAERSFDITVNVDTKQADRSLNSFQKELKNTQKDLQNVGKGSTANLDKFDNKVKATQKNLNKLDNNVVDIRTAMGGLGSDLGGVAGEAGAAAGSFVEMASSLALISTTQQENVRNAQQLNAALDAQSAFVALNADKMEDLRREQRAVVMTMGDLNQELADNDISFQEYNESLVENSRLEREIAGELRVLTDRQGELDDAVNRSRSSISTFTARLLRSKVAMIALGAAAVIAAASMAKLISETITLSGLDSGEFQKFAIATQQFGINAEQAANIIKDFNDKIGDFIITGQGPLIDVMERLGKETGLTTEALVAMSGPDALVALKKAMDDANVSTQEQVFLFESLGSDLSILTPLLAENGKALKGITTEFDTLNSVVSDSALFNLTGLSNEFADTMNLLKTIFLELAGAIGPVVELLLGAFNKALGVVTKAIQLFSSVVNLAFSGLINIAAWIADFTGFDDLANELGVLSAKQLENAQASAKQAFGYETLSDSTKKAQDNVKALRALQDTRAGKESTTLQKQIDNQVLLSKSIQNGTSAYELQAAAIKNTADQEKLRADLQKKGLRPEQIEAIIAKLKELQVAQGLLTEQVKLKTEAEAAATQATEDAKQAAIDAAEAARDRAQTVQDFILDLENQLEFLKATTEAERDAVKARQALKALDSTPEEAARIQLLQQQVAAQIALNTANEQAIRIAEQAAATEKNRLSGISKFEDSLNNQIELLSTRNAEEIKLIEIRQKIAALDPTAQEAQRLEALALQVEQMKEMTRLAEAQEDAFVSLGSAVTGFALGSEKALASIIEQLVIIANLQLFGGNNLFLQGVAGGIRGFADGGQFNAGETFMVGERGPEIITSSAPGSVIPNHQLGGMSGGVSINPTLSINGSVIATEELDRMFTDFVDTVGDSVKDLMVSQNRFGGLNAR